jgi:TP901 family phage tail tape measure protein
MQSKSEMVINITGDPADIQKVWKQLETDAQKAGVKVGQKLAEGTKEGSGGALKKIFEFASGQALYEGAKKGIEKLLHMEEAYEKLEWASKNTAHSMGEDFEAVSLHARNMAENTMYGAEETVQAMAILAKQGQDTARIYETTDDIAELATATQNSLADAYRITAQVMRQYGIDSSRTGDVMDVLAKSSIKGVYSGLSELGDTLGTIAPQAQEMGYSFQEIVGTALGMGNAVKDGGAATSQLNVAMMRLMSIAETGDNTFSKYGIEIKKASGEVKTMAELIDEMAAKGMTAADMVTIFSRRGAKGMTELLNAAKGGVNLVKQATDEVNNASGASAGYAADNLDTCIARSAQLTNALMEMGFVISEYLVAPIEKVIVEYGTDFVKAVSSGARAAVSALGEMREELVSNILGATKSYWNYWMTAIDIVGLKMQLLFSVANSEIVTMKYQATDMVSSILNAMAKLPGMGSMFEEAATSAGDQVHKLGKQKRLADAKQMNLREQTGEKERMQADYATQGATQKSRAGEILAAVGNEGYRAGKETYQEERSRAGGKAAVKQGLGTDVEMGSKTAVVSKAEREIEALAAAANKCAKATDKEAEAKSKPVEEETKKEMMSGTERSKAWKAERKQKTAERRAKWTVEHREAEAEKKDEEDFVEQREDKEYRDSAQKRSPSFKADKEKDEKFAKAEREHQMRYIARERAKPERAGDSQEALAAEAIDESRPGAKKEREKKDKRDKEQWSDRYTTKPEDQGKGKDEKKTTAVDKVKKAQEAAEKKQFVAHEKMATLFDKMRETWQKEDVAATATTKAIETHQKAIEDLKRRMDALATQRSAA